MTFVGEGVKLIRMSFLKRASLLSYASLCKTEINVSLTFEQLQVHQVIGSMYWVLVYKWANYW
jgi:hypothetical protein